MLFIPLVIIATFRSDNEYGTFLMSGVMMVEEKPASMPFGLYMSIYST